MTIPSTLLTKARKIVTPSKKEDARVSSISKKMLERVERASRSYPEVHGVGLGGSFAKGTWLPRDVDIDIFVRISDEVQDQRFEQIGLAIGNTAVHGFPHGKKYAQHPYTEAIVDKTKVNIVPCYDVQPGKWKSAADRSLFHVEFVKQKMQRSQILQVRLLKRFMKTVMVYGAEIEKEGFSGYASEVLVYNHRDFEGVLQYFASLKLEDEGGFSLTDPIDPKRELSTAVSKETIARMILACRSFLGAPDMAYFKKVKTRTGKDLLPRIVAITFDHKRISEDTLWGELKKSTRSVVKFLDAEGFLVARSGATSNEVDKSAILLLPVFNELSSLFERTGPSIGLSQETAKFILKNRERSDLVWVAEDGRIHALQKRKLRNLQMVLEDLHHKGIRGIGVSRDIAVAIQKSGRVLTGQEILDESAKKAWFEAGALKLVSDTIGTDPSQRIR
jgi:tRNA nucleotidyltransferase (CCA-adding enzyme)